jgi:hypothetical protein
MATEDRAPWEVIRAAADRLEKLALEASPGPWEIEYTYSGKTPQAVFRMDPDYPDDPDFSLSLGAMEAPADNEWIATLSPAVAEPLVAWLRATASWAKRECGMCSSEAAGVSFVSNKYRQPLELSHKILGEQP